MHSKRKIPDSWRIALKAKACTSFVLYLKVFKNHLYYLWHVRVLSINHVYIHSFRSIIKATEKFPGGGGNWSPGMDLWWGISTAFRPREGGIWTKVFQKFKCPEGCPGGGVLKLRFDWYIIFHLTTQERQFILPFLRRNVSCYVWACTKLASLVINRLYWLHVVQQSNAMSGYSTLNVTDTPILRKVPQF